MKTEWSLKCVKICVVFTTFYRRFCPSVVSERNKKIESNNIVSKSLYLKNKNSWNESLMVIATIRFSRTPALGVDFLHFLVLQELFIPVDLLISQTWALLSSLLGSCCRYYRKQFVQFVLYLYLYCSICRVFRFSTSQVSNKNESIQPLVQVLVQETSTRVL